MFEHHLYALCAFYTVSIVHHKWGSRLGVSGDAMRDFLIHLTVYSGLLVQLPH